MQKNIKVKPKNLKEKQACLDIILYALQCKINSFGKFQKLQRRVYEKYKISPLSNPVLLNCYKKLIDEKKIIENPELFQLLRKRRIRTSSGIASVAVLTKPYPCPGNCIFCPSQKNVPKSYISNEPAVMRAILGQYDPVEQINIRLRGFELAGNKAEKIELIVMGGTFSYLPRKYQLQFIASCFWTANNYHRTLSIKHRTKKFKLQIKKYNISQLKKILLQEQKKNEKAKYRIIGLTLETRPDYITKNELKWFRLLGCTRIEVGVQSIYDDVLIANNRGHLVEETVKATRLMKEAGFKVCYHLMPNLFYSTYERDLNMFKVLFADQWFAPDMIKIYPCVVTKYAKLANLHRAGKYIPYTDAELIKLLIDIKKIVPPYVRIQRLIRDIPAENIIAGSKISNLRQIIHERKINICQCIRCREIREEQKLPVKIKRFDYDASGGREIFLQYVDKNNRLYALLRLRINPGIKNHWIKELTDCAIIREVHTYGQMTLIGKKSIKDPQHTGLGRKLIKLAENTAKNEFKLKKIAVISGVGVRRYYRRLGYRLKSTYLIKKI